MRGARNRNWFSAPLRVSSAGVPVATATPLVDDDDAVGQFLGLGQLVGGEHHRDAVAAQPVDQLPHHDSRVCIHARGRLVEEDQLGAADHRARQRQPLLLSARQPAVRRAGRLGEAERVHQPLRVQRVGGIGGNEIEHLAGSGGGVRTATLEHHADALAHLGVVAERIQSEDLDRAGVGLDEPLAHLDRGGLARAVRAEQREHLGGRDVQVEARHRGRRPVPLADPAQAHGDG